MTVAIEVTPWPGNVNEKRKKNYRFDAELAWSWGDVLSPCPFCGGKAKLEHTWTASYWIECDDCGGEVAGTWSGDASKPQDHKKAARSAIATWNRRASKTQ